MKKLILTILLASLLPLAHASDTANIRIKLSGSLKDNRYFLCLSSIGCLSIRAAQKGKVYPIYRPFQLYNMYITDLTDLSLHRQNLPSSCSVNVEPNKTLTISGNLTRGSNNRIQISQLQCSVR